jgi:predicted secreted protein
MLQLDERSNGRTVSLQIGQTAEVGLSETPSTGFRWALVSKGEPACALISDSFEPGVKRPGQSGFHRWQFQATAAAEGAIELHSRRSWEQATEPSAVFTLKVKVHP